MTTTAMKQLKKNDFLAALTEKPMTRGELVDALEEYEFIASWLDYLIDHFENLGRIIVDRSGDEVTICRKAKKGGGAAKTAYLVEFDELGVHRRVAQVFSHELDITTQSGGYKMTEREITADAPLDKELGEGTTKQKAVKNAASLIFAQYKADMAAVKALLDAESED